MKSFSAYILLPLLAAMASCSRPGTAPVDDSATFLVDPIRADVLDSSNDPSFRNLANQRRIQFTACVKDVAVQQTIVGAQFRILDGGRVIETKTSDSNGCLVWSELTPFDPLRKESYYSRTRTIAAATVHKGQVTIPLAIDPWLTTKDAVRDLRSQSRPADLVTEEPKADAPATSALVVKEANVQVAYQGGTSRIAAVTISFSPQLSRLALNGDPELVPLTEGTLRARAQLVATYNGREIPLSAPLDFAALPVAGGQAQLSANIQISRVYPRDATLELRLEVGAVDAARGLRPAQLRGDLGKFTGLNLSTHAVLRPAPDLTFSAEPVTSAADQGESPGAEHVGFEVGKVSAERIEVLELNGLGKPRTVEYHMVACLKNPQGMTPLLNEPVVTDVDGVKVELSTDSDQGCRRWTTREHLDFATNQTPIRKLITFRAERGFFQGSSVSRVYYLLPWITDYPVGAVIDEFFEGKPAPTAADQGRRPEIFLSGATVKFKGRTFAIDPQLNLTTIRKYTVNLKGGIRRMTRSSGWLPSDDLGNGAYRIKLLLESEDVEHPTVIDAKTIEGVETRDGTLIFNVEFRFDDLRWAMGRLSLSLEVSPMDESLNLATHPYYDSINLLQGGTMDLVPRLTSLDERMKQAPGRDAEPEFRAAARFAEAYQLTTVDAAKIAELSLPVTELEGIATGESGKWSSLCKLFYQPRFFSLWSSLAGCQAHPERYLNLAHTEHVHTLRSATLAGPVDSTKVSTAASIYYGTNTSRLNSNTVSNSAGGNLNLGGEIPGLSLLGIKVGVGVQYGNSWSHSTSWSHDESHGARRNTDVLRYLNVDQATFRLEADVDQCFVVGLLDQPESHPRYFYCAAKAKNKVGTETYYFLAETLTPGAMQDVDATANAQPFLALVRGTARYQSFLTKLQEGTNALFILNSLAVPANALPTGRANGAFPGLLSAEKF